MTLDTKLRLSYYQAIGFIDKEHGVKLVQHVESNRIFVFKTLTVYDLQVFQYLKDHPAQGIPLIEDLIEDDGTLYVIEEYISGDNLRDLLDRNGPLSEDEAIDIAIQLCRILSPLHRLPVPLVHRDIKPGNLILARDHQLMLVDFNSAKESRTGQGQDTILIGTAGYAAPEQYGFSVSQPTADIYAIGVLLNELLTGELPTHKKYEGRLQPILERCLKMDPTKRYQSVDRLSLALSLRRGRADPATRRSSASRSALHLGREFLPPGFRTGNVGHMVLCSLWYVLITLFIFSCTTDGGLVDLIFFRVTCSASFLAVTLWVGNYLDVWQKFPLARSDNPAVRTFGVIFWIFPIFLTIITIGAILFAPFLVSAKK